MGRHKGLYDEKNVLNPLQVVNLFVPLQPQSQDAVQGVMLEWLKRHAWKACNRQKRFASSNLAHSATTMQWNVAGWQPMPKAHSIFLVKWLEPYVFYSKTPTSNVTEPCYLTI